MNKIASFRLCKLSDEELLKKVDEGTDNIFKTGIIPSCHIPARPDSDYDLLIGELLLRFKERLHPSPSAPVVAGNDVHEKSLAALDKLIKEQPELIEKINKELDKFGFEGPTISEYFASFGHSPAERIDGEPSAKAIAEAAKNTCDIPGCKKIAPQNDIFCKDHRY